MISKGQLSLISGSFQVSERLGSTVWNTMKSLWNTMKHFVWSKFMGDFSLPFSLAQGDIGRFTGACGAAGQFQSPCGRWWLPAKCGVLLSNIYQTPAVPASTWALMIVYLSSTGICWNGVPKMGICCGEAWDVQLELTAASSNRFQSMSDIVRLAAQWWWFDSKPIFFANPTIVYANNLAPNQWYSPTFCLWLLAWASGKRLHNYWTSPLLIGKSNLPSGKRLNSYWKWPFIWVVDLPMFFFHGDLFNIVLNVSKETPIINGGIPSHHPFEIGIFHEINTPFEATNHFGYPNNGWFSSFPNQKKQAFCHQRSDPGPESWPEPSWPSRSQIGTWNRISDTKIFLRTLRDDLLRI